MPVLEPYTERQMKRTGREYKSRPDALSVIRL